VELLNQQKRSRAQLDDMLPCVEKALQTGAGHFIDFWRNPDSLTELERDILLAICVQTDVSQADKTALARLLKKEILAHTDQTWRFQVPLLAHFVAKQVNQ